MEGKVEEEKGAMAEDEEEMAEAGEVEKRRMHQCSECGKRYKHEHKLKHHKTWLCKERALGQVQSEPRRELSSNFFHLPTIPEGEEVFASERVSKPCDQGEGGGTIASERVSKPQDEDGEAGAVICDQCQESFPSRSAAKNHRRRYCKVVEVISLCDICCSEHC